MTTTWAAVAVVALVLMGFLIMFLWVVDARHADQVSRDRGRFRE